MINLTVFGLLLGLTLSVLCQQYEDGDRSNQVYRQSDYHNTPPPPQILSHKQALNHDGNFKYLFTSENGLAQGESIAPDGSRNGGYSYTDPTGRKITVKYTAGKEGFKILEADHLPKAPLPVAPLPVQAPHQTQAAYGPQSFAGQQDDGQYRPALYERPSPQLAQLPRYISAGAQPQISHAQPRAAYPTQTSNALGEREQEYNDEPGKPYSFGNGYIFEFSG